MRAFLLAAGMGTRLRPLTDRVPKCLVSIAGRPLLGWWIDLMERHGIDQVLINTHHLSEMVERYVREQNTKVKFVIFREPKLLGSAGTLRANREFVVDQKDFFIFYADNLTNYNLSDFLTTHRRSRSIFSMALFRANNIRSCGIAQIDSNGIITGFEEKPAQPKSNLANAGLYITEPSILDLIPEKECADIGFDLLPLLTGKMKGWIGQGYLRDIGTMENLKKAEEEWPAIMEGKA